MSNVRPDDTDWCDEAGMSYGMKRVIDQSLRMFLPLPFHDQYCDCYFCRPVAALDPDTTGTPKEESTNET